MKEWKLVDHPDIPGMMLVEGPAFRVVICTQASNIAFPEYRQIMADARLMVAAPEMYELIQRLALSTKQYYAPSVSGAKKIHALHQLQEAAEKLLTKIEGGGE